MAFSSFKVGERVQLTAMVREEIWKVRDIGTRAGTVAMVGNAVAVMFDGMKILTWFPEQALERVG